MSQPDRLPLHPSARDLCVTLPDTALEVLVDVVRDAVALAVPLVVVAFAVPAPSPKLL